MKNQNKDPKDPNAIDESKRANKNSENWNNIVLQHGMLMNEFLCINKPNPSLADDYKLARKRNITNSIDTNNDFNKTMITLVSGFFIAYFALVKFLGVQSVSDNTQMLLLVAPISFIMSIMFLQVGLMPLYFDAYKNRTDSENRTLKNFGEDIHNKIRNKKYVPMIIGMGLFVLGLIFTIIGSFDLFMQLPFLS
jgi:hypothetical protein